jgi:gliding motility-associated-like protein
MPTFMQFTNITIFLRRYFSAGLKQCLRLNKPNRTSAFMPLLLLLLSSALSGQGSFHKVLKGTSGVELGRHVLETDNGFLIAGYTSSSGAGGKDAYLTEIDKLGNVLWQRTYGGSSDDAFSIITKGNNGGYLALGNTVSTGNGDQDVLLVKIDDAGNVEWSKTFGGALLDVSPVHGVMVNLADGYLISGQQLSTPGNGSDTGTYMIRFDNDGNVIWTRNYESASNYLVANYVEGNIIYAGGGRDYEACFAKFDLTTGDLIALKSYGGSGYESLYNIRPTADGNFILSDGTWSYDGSAMSLWVMKVNKDGDIIWSKIYRKQNEGIRGTAIPTADGGIFIVPYYTTTSNSNDGLFLKTDADGTIEWSAKYGVTKSENFIKGILTSDGGYIGIGRANDTNGKEHIYVVKTDELGSIDECCANPNTDIITDVFMPDEGSGSFNDATPFIPVNWTIGNAASNLTIADYCVNAPPPTFDIEPATCGNPQGGAVQVIGLPSLTYSFAGGQFLPPTTYNLLAGGTYSVVVKSSSGCTQSYQVVVPFIGYNMVDTPLIETMLCANTSTVTINPTTGFTPFQYQLGTTGWGASNVFSGLEPADYTIFVQDNNGCLDTLNFTINPGNAPQIDNVQITQADCNNPSATITVTALGGVGGYSYQIDAGQSSQSTGVFTINQSGSYTITITDQDGCTTQTPALLVDISVPEVPVFETTAVTCADPLGGSVLIMGGSSSLYSFNGGAFEPPKIYKNLVAGTYNVILKGANGCEYPYTVEIPSLVYKIAGTATIDQKPCSDSNMVVLKPSSGVAPFQYRLGTGAWSNNSTFDSNIPGTYTAYIQDSNQCKDTISFSIAPYSPLLFGSITIQNIDCLHPIGSIQLTANGGSGSGYSYSIGSGSPQNNDLFELTSPGNYTITVTDSEGCTTTTPPIIITKNVQPIATESTLDICSDQTLTLPDGTTTNVTGNYVFQLKAASGCDSTHTVRLEVTEASLYIPNVFHPNDDGINDWFTLYSSIDCIKSIKYLRVYDRWGSLFFERKDFPTNIDKLGWDGTIEGGKKADTGVYIYDCVLVLASGAEVEYSGDVTVVR